MVTITNRFLRTRRRALLAMFIIAASASCGPEVPTVPASDAILVYAILAKDSLLPGDSIISALVATAGTPTEARYRSVERFTMTRERDGAPFAWSIHSLAGTAIPLTPLSSNVPVAGNVTLERALTPRGLGRDSLEYGESYAVSISTGGVQVTGHATLPERPAPVRLFRDGHEIVAWPHLHGAAGYAIRVDTDRQPTHALADTQYVLVRDVPADELPPEPRFIVIALDSNLIRFLMMTDVRSAGLERANGVIGAMSAQSLSLAPLQQ